MLCVSLAKPSFVLFVTGAFMKESYIAKMGSWEWGWFIEIKSAVSRIQLLSRAHKTLGSIPVTTSK